MKKALLRKLATAFFLLIFVFNSSSIAIASENYSGTGDQIIDLKASKKTVFIHLTHQGNSNFIVSAKDKNAENISLLVNEIGNYSGNVIIYPDGKTLKYLEITADGNWTAEIKSLGKSRKWNKKNIEGSGDDVIQLGKPLPSSTKLKLTFTGNDNFIVTTFNQKGQRLDLKANEIGNYSGTKFLGKSVKYLEIIGTGGTWKLEK